MEQTIEIPEDAKTITLELKKQCTLTLRSLLPQIGTEVELVVEDVFDLGDFDMYRLRANSGDSLLHKLARSRVVDGESILGLTPRVRFVAPQTSLVNGTFLAGAGCIQLVVKPPVPED